MKAVGAQTGSQINSGRPLMPWRRFVLMAAFGVVVLVLSGRALDMQVLHSDFFVEQGDARRLRVVAIPAHRGDIVDRHGEPLAISTPVSSVWLHPGEINRSYDSGAIRRLAKAVDMDAAAIRQKIEQYAGREFVYLKRHVSPKIAGRVAALGMAGVYLQDEYRRFYPAGEAAAHVVGFANIDDNGQEGIELAYNEWLQGVNGKKQVIRDRIGRAVKDVQRISNSEPGKPIQLSIDARLQYLTYRTLKSAVLKHNAVAGSAVVLDVDTGEVLAMANQPSFNVNDRTQLRPGTTRNRAVTDVFEPGSTMKPLTIAAALDSGRWQPDSKVETGPGYLSVRGNMIRDTHNHGDLDVGGVIAKSSNVGISKIALSLDAEMQWDMYRQFGLGANTGSGFPGEAGGRLSVNALHNDFERATMAFGYGVSVTPLQLARAYAAIAADGLIRPVTFLKNRGEVEGVPVMSPMTARAIRGMMQRVVSDGGTGNEAGIANYTVAGKTGTVHKADASGYAEDRYQSIFGGMVPAKNPELVMVVMIDEPRNGEHFGGQVAAPVFSTVMSGAVRLLNIAPDAVQDERLVMEAKETGPAGERA